MSVCSDIQYFLGANSPGGFHSLYSEMLPPEQARAIYILKGGPGCGKSTLMRVVGRRAREAGLRTEFILCSGDPDSLDGLILPDLKVALTDGTTPHVMEARYPGAVERYVNLGSCYNSNGLYPIRQDIMDCNRVYKDWYRRGYRCLDAAAELMEDARTPLLTRTLSEKLARRAKGILSRELPPIRGAAPGHVTQRFLNTPTHRGMVFLYETAQIQCPRIYQLADSFGLGHHLLLELLTGAVERGYHPIACPDPMFPNRLVHLLVPEAGVAFLTSRDPLPEKPFRRLRLDAMADAELVRQNRSSLRFSRRVSDALLDEATFSFARAKAGHDDLEALYHPYVDFAEVDRYTQTVCNEILAMAQEVAPSSNP